MRVAVTGAGGFVGRHVVAALAARGVDTVAMLRSGAAAENFPNGVRTVLLDLHAPPDNAHEALGRPDAVVHLAWGGLPHYRAHSHFDAELPAQYAFLRSLVGAGLRCLVATGTCLEYGLQSGPLPEDGDTHPTTPYGFAKDALRRQLGFLRAERPFALTWARLFYLHGEGQAPTSLFPLLRTAAERGDARFPMSGGEQLRDYLPVTEAAGILAQLAVQGCDAGAVNVCAGRPVSVRALVERWIAEHGWSVAPDLGRYPYPDYEPLAFWGDRRRLDAALEIAR